MKTGGMVDMKKLKERGKDKYVQNRLRIKLTCTACLGLCSPTELGLAAAFIRLEVPFVLCKEYVI